MAIADILNELRASKEKVVVKSIWRENPVPLNVFVESIEYCNLPPLTPIQYTNAVAILGEDPKKMFDPVENTGKSIAVLLWGKGSGKDYLTSIIQLYCIYVILCLEEPQEYFNQAPGEPLDVINVAYSGEQAKNVYFAKFLERLERCRWFKTHFNLIHSGRGKRNPSAWGDVRIGATTVIFPHSIRAISETSENESYEGYNIIVWIMDEASAFKSAKRIENASKIYNTLKSSAKTRFADRWKGFVLSYPRAEDEWDFTIQLYNEALKNPDTMHGSREFSWDVAPATTYPGPRYRFVYDRQDQHIELDVPATLIDEFIRYPETSLGTYCCMPGRSEGAFIEMSGAIARVLHDRTPIFEVESIIVESPPLPGAPPFRGLGYRITKWHQSEFDEQKKYVIHVDCGLNHDRAAVVLGHGEPILVELEYPDGHKEHRWVQVVVEDAHVIYEPDNERNLRVSINNIADLILSIADVIPLKAVTFDRWNSAGSVETLALQGIDVKEHNINRDDFGLLRSIIYSGDVDLLNTPLTERELIQLRKVPGGNVDHPVGGSKDLADGLAGITRLILGNNKSKNKQKQQAKDVGVPTAATAYSHNPDPGNFILGSPMATRNIAGNATPNISPVSRMGSSGAAKISLPSIPTMPFGLGDSSRARPRIRTINSSKELRQQKNTKSSSPYGDRIKELSA